MVCVAIGAQAVYTVRVESIGNIIWFGGWLVALIDGIVFVWFCRYLTWDLAKFPNPEAMQNKLAVKGRKVRGRDGRGGEVGCEKMRREGRGGEVG